MKSEIVKVNPATLPTSNEFASKIQAGIYNCNRSGRVFFIVVIQIANIDAYRKRRPAHVVNRMMRELGAAVRGAVHSSQYVGFFQNGLGLVFDAVDPGQMDNIVARLTLIIQSAIRKGKYNDFTNRWTDIIHQFLHPNNPGILYPCLGWSIYPRDGASASGLVQRALFHILERERNKKSDYH